MIRPDEAWSRFDPAAPPELTGAASGGAIVAILVSAGATRGGWVSELIGDLVRAWTRTGRRLVLADAQFEAPSLHTAFGLSNAEGLSAILGSGAPVQRVAHVVRGGGFYFIPAGTAPADVSSAVAGDRWDRTCRSLLEAGVTFAVVVPVEGDARPGVVAKSTDVIVVSDPAEVVRLDAGLAGKLRAVVGLDESPPFDLPEVALPEVVSSPAVAAEPVGADSEPVVTATGPLGTAVEPPIDDWVARRTELRDVLASRPTGHEVRREPIKAPAVGRAKNRRPPAARSRSTGRRNRLFWILLGLGVVVAVLVLVGRLPLLGTSAADGVPAPAVTTGGPEPGQPAVSAAPTRVTGVAAYSVTIAAHRAAEFAETQVAALRRTVPEVVFTSVPVEVQGDVFYRVLAGAAVDSTAAVQVADSVAGALDTSASGWIVRSTPLAFLLGEHDDLEEAELHSEELSDQGLPAYVLALDFSDGSVRYRVYSGAYADEAEASQLAELLEGREVGEVRLTDRTGRTPS
jgi:hypothetical protein